LKGQTVFASIFFEFALPNAATWFYFSVLLGLAVFFRFDRILSLRNWDLITFYLVAPGLLLLIEAHAELAANPPPPTDFERESTTGERLLQVGYFWLIGWSVYFFARALFDLGLEKRPSLTQNLNLPGLVWLALALAVTLGAVAVRRMPDAPVQVGRDPVALTKVKQGAEAVVADPEGQTGSARVWAERCVAIALHLAVVVALALIGGTHFRDPLTGMGMVGLYLMLPMTAYHFGQVHHVWPTVFILWAVYAYRRPLVAGSLIGVAAGTVFFPFLLFPLWFGFYRERGAGKFTLGFLLSAGLGLGLTAAILLWSGELRQYWNVAISLSDWQAWKAPTNEGIWTGSHWAYRLPVFIAYMTFVALTAFWPKPRNLAQVVAQSAAVVIGVQFWYADQGGVYVLWYMPLLLLMAFRPNLSEVRPPAPADDDWMSARVRRAAGWMSRLRRRRPTPASVA
jgi:hypothetical protein